MFSFNEYWGEDDFKKYYFTSNWRIFSDKLSKFVEKCNTVTNGDVISRICRIYSHIYIDEVQDLAGYDLELIKLLFKSRSNILLVGDYYQHSVSALNNHGEPFQIKKNYISYSDYVNYLKSID